jgi:hypothetical protein
MDEVLKYWPIITFAVVAVIAIGSHHEKIKQIEHKITELFRLWNSRK